MISKKKYPKKARFFLADVIHADGNNVKPTLIGFFPNDAIGLMNPTKSIQPSDTDPVVLQSLGILTSFSDCHGEFEVAISLFLPDGKPVFENRKIEMKLMADSKKNEPADANFIVQFQSFKITQLGTYKFIVYLDSKSYEYRFRVQLAAVGSI